MKGTNSIWPQWAPRVLWMRRVCPCCNSVEFKQAEAHPFDGVLRLFALRPVRCKFCWRRFYWITLNDRYAS
jgi:hypothetical protein